MLWHTTSTAQPSTLQAAYDSLHISVITCSAGGDIPTSFGHSAIRLRNTQAQPPLDIVFDYGTFNYGDPLFLLKFGRGTLLYYLSIRDYRTFALECKAEKRQATEQELQLTPEQRKRITTDLFTNYRPENRYYLYDFITDNCATRIRDILEHPDFAHPQTSPDSTYRQMIHTYLPHKHWFGFAVDALLGPSTDAKADFLQSLFLPYTLSAGLKNYTNTITDAVLVSDATVIVPCDYVRQGEPWPLRPFPVFALLLALSVWLDFAGHRRLLHGIAVGLFVLICVVGLVLLFLWLGSRYSCTKWNLNLLWCMPLYILLLLPLGARFKRWVVLLQCALLIAVLLLGWWALPQQFNVAVYPLAATLLLLNYNELQILRK